MEHLLKIVTNKHDVEAMIRTAPPRKKSGGRGGKNGGKQVYICYEINGFWFRLSRMDWCHHLQLSYGKICGRQKSGKPIGVVLGFEKDDKRARKNAGRKKGSKNKDYL